MAEKKVCIRIAGNTEIPCFMALQAKGYAVKIWYQHFNGRIDQQVDAEKDGHEFSGTSAEEVLGLIAMWEVRGNDWQRDQSGLELYDLLRAEAVIYDPEGNVID